MSVARRQSELKAAYRHADRIVRDGDRDRWLASLFAAAEERPHLLAVLAFNVEIARIREVIREPQIGIIRAKWWRDVVTGDAAGDAEGHPVARALRDTIDIYRLPTGPFVDLIDARTFDLYEDAMPTIDDLEGYAGETASALFQLGAIILNKGAPAETADAAGHGGVAYALTGLMRALPLQARRGQVYLPKDLLARHGLAPHDVRSGLVTPGLITALAELRARAQRHLDAARKGLADVPVPVLPAFLPLALVPLWLKALETADPYIGAGEVSLVKRQWTLWRAARAGRQGRAMF
ncbi:phytoene/squalene synthase family protein [Methylobrevis albus]|uniref:Phytoene/squalene synthase family protein n=1 Tax=Methylobrevis albus TaxID=2793297 RepID=A0A931N0B6_9HYPH|nr:phytoene/squalene synthase family protein [Methylobrevis albus]MBH0239004.1 phytoene/squalene synthase family protein [Methylobrevis albus]